MYRDLRGFRPLVISLFVLFAAFPLFAASVIVELNEEPAAVAAAKARAAGTPWSADQVEAHRAALRAGQDRLLDALRAKGVAFQLGGVAVESVRVDYRYTLVYNGMAMVVPDQAIPLIEAMPQVKKVHADKVARPLLDHSVNYIRAPEVYGAVAELSRYDNAREGFEGQGIYLSVIDSGISWSHEMFGGDPTPPRLGVEPDANAVGRNEKVVYYLPLADDAEDGSGHGTHVASTAAGYLGFAPGEDDLPLTGDEIRLHGVAPQARIMAYKVCSDALGAAVGGCLESSIVMAIEDSASPRTVNGFPKPVAHVINMSLGGPGDPDDPYGVASDNATLLGVTVVAAAGNDGPAEDTAGSPCVGRRVICVANSLDRWGSWSFDVLAKTAVNPLLPGAVTPADALPRATGSRAPVQLLAMGGAKAPPSRAMAQYFVYVAGGETPASYPANVSGRIAVVNPSLPYAYAQVANSAYAAGAIAVIVNDETANPTALKTPIPAANIGPEGFAYLKELASGSPSVEPANGALSKFPIRLAATYDTATISHSSSRGPVAGLGQVKPDVTAPGTFILSGTSPVSQIGATEQINYASISGTSMASPHVAGAAALIKQAHPAWTPDMIRTVLQNTATNLRAPDGTPNADGGVERVLDQGAGLIDVRAAVQAKGLLGIVADGVALPSILGSHSFGAVEAINTPSVTTRSATVTLRDVSGTASAYSLAVVNNRGLDLPGVSVTVDPSGLSVPANGVATATVTVRIDGGQVTNGQSLDLQWYLRAAGGGETLSMPFFLRATRTQPAAAVLAPISDDATPDQQNGVDRDGRYSVTWSYPDTEPARPCSFRIEEAQSAAAGTIWYDDGETLMTTSGNAKWTSSMWTSRPHPNTLSLGYAPVYIDENTASITMTGSVALPNALVTLTFESFEDIELDFDYGYVDLHDGESWKTLATYTGTFSGQRSVDLTAYAGRSVQLRFRLVSDQLYSTPVVQGWYVDDIRIQAGAAFHTLATVSAGTSSLAIGGKQDGTWAYRVVALFDCGAGAYATAASNIEQIEVSNATAPPMAVFSSTPNPSDAGQAVSFDAGASADQDSVNGGGIVRYQWSFGDGATESSSSPAASHAYSTPGTYRVVLVVTDDDGESASTEALQTVREVNANLSAAGSVPSGEKKANFSVDVVQSGGLADGKVQWHDLRRKTKIHSTQIDRVERSGNRATVYGQASIDKKQTAPFVLELVDNGSSGDTISITSGDYSAGGTVSGGDVVVRE